MQSANACINIIGTLATGPHPKGLGFLYIWLKEWSTKSSRLWRYTIRSFTASVIFTGARRVIRRDDNVLRARPHRCRICCCSGEGQRLQRTDQASFYGSKTEESAEQLGPKITRPFQTLCLLHKVLPRKNGFGVIYDSGLYVSQRRSVQMK